MKVNTVVSGAGEKLIMPKKLFKYVLYSHLFIHILCSNVDDRNETNSVEGTTQKRIVPIITEDNVVYYAYPQVKAESIAKRDNETTKQSSVFQTATDIKRPGNKITYPAELNDLDAVFTDQINSTLEKARGTQATKNLTSAGIMLGDRNPENVLKESTNIDKNHLKDLSRITALRSKFENKMDVHKDRKIKHMDFFGSFIEPFEIGSSEDQSTSQEMENGRDKIKRILQWSKNDSYPFINITSAGQKAFIDRNCSFTNCVIIKKNSSNFDVQEFDAVLFFGKDMMSDNKLRKHIRKLSKKRLQHQKYIFVDSEYHQLPRLQQLNNFFNWTFTYKLNSDLIISPFVIKNATGKVVAPSRNVTWIKNENMGHISIDVMNHLIQKSVPLIWFYPCETVRSVGNCYIRRLVRSLKIRYSLHVDRINSCWYKESSSDIKALISKIIKRDYYFFMGFEDIERGDYVSDKILPALNNYAVPIVFGGANYSRFLPDNSYLDAVQYTPNALAEQIYKLVRDFNLYVDYFKWKSHYSVHKPEESPETDYVCKMCEMLNDETKLKETSFYGEFNEWWGDQEKESTTVEDFYAVSTRRDDYYTMMPKKKPITAKEILRHSARAYTQFVDSLIDNVKTVFSSIFG